MRRAIASILVCVLAAHGACDQRAPEADAPDAPAITRSVEAEPLRVELTVSDSSITTAQRARLTITTSASESIDVTMTDIEAALEDWTVTAMNGPTRSVREDRVVTERAYRLEPFLPGTYDVPALSFAWADDASDASGELTTDPLAVEVVSVLDAESGADPADIKSIATPEREIDWPLVALVGAGVLAVIGALVALLVARSRRERPIPIDRVPAHEVALSALDSIDPSFTDEYGAKRFFDEVSSVVRTYIEDRFAIHAPERTTEEFLRESRVHSELSREDLDLLERFLNLCDLVKFARHRVDPSDARATLDSARTFIKRTSDPSRVVLFNRETGERLGVETLSREGGVG